MTPRARLLCSTLAGLCAGLLASAAQAQSTTPISALPAATTPLAGTEVVPVVQSSTTKKATVSSIAQYATASVLAYGAVCDGTTDDHVAIQAAINAVETGGNLGGVVNFPIAACNIGSVGLTVTGNSVRLAGAVNGTVTTGTGSRLLYSGTGSAITYGVQNYLNFNNGLNNITIVASGSAASSATAVGVTLNNSQYLISHGLGIQGFTAGVGLLVQANGSGTTCSPAGYCFTAANSFYDVGFYGNHIGLRSTAINSGTGENTLGVTGGWIIGDNSAGSVGMDLQTLSNGGVAANLDVESYANCYNVVGGDWRFMGTHSEFCTQHITLTAASIHNTFYGHIAASVSGGYASIWSDAGADNHWAGAGSGGTPTIGGKTTFRPSFDACEVVNFVNNANQSQFDYCSSGGGTLNLANGIHLVAYSDNFLTQTWDITSGGAATFPVSVTTAAAGVNGLLTAKQFNVTSPSMSNFINWYDSAGDPILVAHDGGSRSASDLLFGELNGCVDNACTSQSLAFDAVHGTLFQQPPTDGTIVTVRNAAGTNALTLATNTTISNSTLGFAGGITAASLKDTGVTGSTQCLQADTTGAITGTGSACGGSGATGANPTAKVGPTAVNGVATTYLRSDGAPAIDLTATYPWTGVHTFNTSNLRLLGSSTGYTTVASANASATNYTLTIPAATGTLQLVGAPAMTSLYQGSAFGSTVTSTTAVALGMGTTTNMKATNGGAAAGGTITPATSGRVLVTIAGTIKQATAAAADTFQIYYGTGGAPTNNTAPGGTAVGSTLAVTPANTTGYIPFTVTQVVTGLTVGTTYWFDLGVTTGSGSDALTMGSMQEVLQEF